MTSASVGPAARRSRPPAARRPRAVANARSMAELWAGEQRANARSMASCGSANMSGGPTPARAELREAARARWPSCAASGPTHDRWPSCGPANSGPTHDRWRAVGRRTARARGRAARGGEHVRRPDARAQWPSCAASGPTRDRWRAVGRRTCPAARRPRAVANATQAARERHGQVRVPAAVLADPIIQARLAALAELA